MEIIKGKTYEVSPAYKKCFVETEEFIHCDDPDKIISVSTLWRNGTVLVTPQTDEEVDLLSGASYNEDDDEFEPYDFEDTEFVSVWDGVSEDLGFNKRLAEELSEDEQLKIEEGYHEDSFSFLEEIGYDSADTIVTMHGEIDIAEFKGYDS